MIRVYLRIQISYLLFNYKKCYIIDKFNQSIFVVQYPKAKRRNGCSNEARQYDCWSCIMSDFTKGGFPNSITSSKENWHVISSKYPQLERWSISSSAVISRLKVLSNQDIQSMIWHLTWNCVFNYIWVKLSFITIIILFANMFYVKLKWLP